mmetsp:Transcript_24910/g.43673  ORF Transcript_24910/g.43673 Transcript_24910/m.43673 type:complete len:96 (-) Transcript_24910:411-698(-)
MPLECNVKTNDKTYYVSKSIQTNLYERFEYKEQSIFGPAKKIKSFLVTLSFVQHRCALQYGIEFWFAPQTTDLGHLVRPRGGARRPLTIQGCALT